MQVYFRCCEKQESISTTPRWNNLPKSQILKTCWLSLLPGLKEQDKIIILQDNIKDETLDFLVRTIPDGITFEVVDIPEHEWTHNLHTIELFKRLEKDINMLSDHETFYIVEDDYLHIPEALNFISDAANWFSSCFLAPYDYPDRYKQEQIAPTLVYPGPGCHWRLNPSSTMTLAAKGFVWKKYINKLHEAAPTSNDKVFEEIFKETPCLSPLPGIATHLTPYHMTMYINWEELWNEINYNIG